MIRLGSGDETPDLQEKKEMRQSGEPIRNSRARVWIAIVILLFLAPAGASAGTEITGVIGGLIGGDLNSIIDNGSLSITRSFSNAPLYGVRVGYHIPFLIIEGSFVGSPHGLTLDVPDISTTVDTKVYYLEANAVFVPIPGFISPFVTAGIGLDYFDFAVQVANFGSLSASFNKVGYNFGAGLKLNFSQLVIRGEIRDHITDIGPEDFGVGDIADELGIDAQQRLHNVEISFGVGIRF